MTSPYAVAEAEIEAYMTRNFPVGDGTSCYRSVTGESYVVLAAGQIKEQGESVRVFTSDIDKAVDVFKEGFDKYVEGKAGTLYWRRMPEVRINTYPNAAGGTDEYYYISARFLISDKPRMSAAELDQAGISDCITTSKE